MHVLPPLAPSFRTLAWRLLAWHALAWPALASGAPAQPTQLAAQHRSGQTFLTWQERSDLSGERYRVYRSDAPIDASSLGAAELLLEVPEGSARFFANRYRKAGGGWRPRYLDRYVIADGGTELPAGTGLLVWTLHAGEAVPGGAYYAVTTVLGSSENRDDLGPGNAIGPVDEEVADPRPVRTAVDVGAGGTLYVQFQDVRDWNPTFHAPHAGNAWYGLSPSDPAVSGALQYAYDYVVYAPQASCATGPRAPVVLYLHGWTNGTYAALAADPLPEYCGYKILPVDEGDTWWFGFAESHDYRTGTPVEAGDRVPNYTERRVLRMVHDLLTDPVLGDAVDPERVFVFGHSMGASGTLALALRYPQVFAAAFANEPMTRYRTAGDGGGRDWRPEIAERWGDVALDLPVVLDAPAGWALPLAAHDGTGVWDWQDHQANVFARRADELVPLGLNHGSLDTTIEWSTQGRPVYALLDGTARCWGGAVLPVGHRWNDFAGLLPTLGPDGLGVPFAGLRARRDETVPGLSRCSADSPLPPPGTAAYEAVLDWAASWNPWDAPPEDQRDRWEVSLRSLAGTTVQVDVTPRRTQRFAPAPLEACAWRNHDLATDTDVASGTVQVDADGLVTVPAFLVGPAGNRLVLELAAPGLHADLDASPTSGQAPLAVAFTDLSTGPVASWSWAFGDGETSSERHPAHVYAAAGTYDVSLTVSAPGASDTVTRPDLVRVSPAPEVELYGCGVNPAGSLVFLGGTARLGDTLTLGVDNPLGTQGAGSRPVLYLSSGPDPGYPCGRLLRNWGMAGPGASGELLILRGGGDPFLALRGAPWTGPGSPVPMGIRLPTSASFLGMAVYVQGVLTDPNVTFGVRSGLTEAARFVIRAD